MSTFNGVVKEFPDIRIDHFRLPNEPTRPPLAYFLSHVHSDHLQGLESCKSPFIYCSPATKEVLLRLEKYPHRMNFARGILESRKQTYRHLKKLLKTIPLQTPTVIDLAPGKSIRVTLFDANHCVGAVMFLIEGDGKAVLYTGDIRSEPWWVDGLTRNPTLIPYAANGNEKPLKQLDCVYLDTTFATKENQYKHFFSKAEGTSELLRKISKYPSDTIFYFDTWTFGYEDVWIALCNFINCQVHVDDYRYKLYRALATGEEPRSPEAAVLFGYTCGNHFQEGCLTTRQSRLHSCERGTDCDVFKKDFVRITPIVSRHDGVEMAELGAGGGKGDLDQQHELEIGDAGTLGMLISLCATKLKDQPQVLGDVVEMLASLAKDHVQSISLDPSTLHSDIPGVNEEDVAELENLPLERLVPALTSIAAKTKALEGTDDSSSKRTLEEKRTTILPKRITFPYSRHSSYTELCHLIAAFKPKDIWPCTVEKPASWSASQSMSFLFGHLYDSTPRFTHDQIMFRHKGERGGAASESTPASLDLLSKAQGKSNGENGHGVKPSSPPQPSNKKRRRSSSQDSASEDRPTAAQTNDQSNVTGGARLAREMNLADGHDNTSLLSSPAAYTVAWQREAYEAALGTDSGDWNDISLVSVSGYHQEREEEL